MITIRVVMASVQDFHRDQQARRHPQNGHKEVQTMNHKLLEPSMSRLNSLMEGSGYSIHEDIPKYVLCDRHNKEIARSKKLRSLRPFIDPIISERNQMVAAGKDVNIRLIIKPTRQVTFTSPDDSTKRTYHILALVEWDRVVVKYFKFDAFVYEVMKSFVDWYIAGRLG